VIIYSSIAARFKITENWVFFLSHRVKTLLVLDADLAFSCSIRCLLPRKHQLRLPPPHTVRGRGHWAAYSLKHLYSAVGSADAQLEAVLVVRGGLAESKQIDL